MRIIDADELKKMFPDKGEGSWTYNITAKAYIDAAPTVDLWHYIAKGELPPNKKPVFCLLWNGNYVVAYRLDNAEWTTNGRFTFDGVRCWQYIVPPKEEE